MSIDRRYRLLKSSIDVLDLVSASGATIPPALLPAASGVTSVLGTANQIAVATVGGVATVSLSPNIIVPAPPSGIALTLNGAAAQIGVFNGTAGNTYFDYQRVSVLVGRIGSADSIVVSGANTDFALSAPGGGLNFATGGSSVSRMTINGTGNVAIAAPGSGVALTVTAASGLAAYQAITGSFYQADAGGTVVGLALNSTGANFGQIYNVGTQQWALGAGTNNVTPGNKALTWADGSGSLPLVQIVAAGTGTSVFAGTGRATLQLNGSTDALIDFSINGSSRGYLFGNNTSFDMNTPSGNPIRFQTGNTTKMTISGAGVVDITTGNLTLAGVAVSFPTTGSFTGTFTGVTGSPTVACSWTKVGNSVTLFVGASSQTGNATSYGLSGLPAAIQPTTIKYGAGPNNSVNSGAVTGTGAVIVSGSTLIFLLNGTATGWAAAGTRAFGDVTRGSTITYDVS